MCAIAGELRLPIYMLRLSGAGLDDEAFHRLLAGTARRAVVLLEDVDAAAGAAVGTSSATISGGGGGGGGEVGVGGKIRPMSGEFGGGGGGSETLLTLPGLLNALDGVGAVDGRLLFMTCHRAESLEPALVRPGRIDRRLRFGPPDAEQAEALFRHFYGNGASGGVGGVSSGCSSEVEAEVEAEEEEEEEEDEDGQFMDAEKKEKREKSAKKAHKAKPVAFGGAPPPLDPAVLDVLARKFAAAAVVCTATSFTDPTADAASDAEKRKSHHDHMKKKTRGGATHPDTSAAAARGSSVFYPSSMAALQAHLMMHREDPEGAVEAAGDW